MAWEITINSIKLTMNRKISFSLVHILIYSTAVFLYFISRVRWPLHLFLPKKKVFCFCFVLPFILGRDSISREYWTQKWWRVVLFFFRFFCFKYDWSSPSNRVGTRQKFRWKRSCIWENRYTLWSDLGRSWARYECICRNCKQSLFLSTCFRL